jgi:hypothetical protein
MLSEGHQPLAYFRWEHERAPYVIELSLEMVGRLSPEISAAARQKREIGGLLLGSFPKSRRLTLRIDDYLVIPAAETDQSRYDLSAEQRSRLSTARRRLLEQQTAVLGFFRSNRRNGGLTLSEEDRAFLKLEFRRAIHAALLISTGGAHTASFFMADANGAMQAGPPLSEFPFDSEQLAPSAVALGQIPSGTTNFEPEPAFSAGAQHPAKSSQLGFWIGVAAVVVFICLFLTAWAPTTMRLLGAGQALDLSATRRSHVIELRWNQRQPDLLRATSGTLSIKDGLSTRQWTLSPSEIRSGSIAYQPVKAHVRFTLTLHLPQLMEVAQSVDSSRQ